MCGIEIKIGDVAHEVLGDPSPLLLHQVYADAEVVPVAKEAYDGQLADIYRANGRVLVAKVCPIDKMSTEDALAKIWRRVGKLPAGQILGPALHSQCVEAGGRVYRGIGIWSIREAHAY